MSLQAMYNHISARYATANRFGAINESYKCAIAQIRRANLGLKTQYKVLDLSVGNGAFLEELKIHMPRAEFTGIDISAEMLTHAHELLHLTTIEASATDASQYLPHYSQDLVLAHFINAYIPIKNLFNQAKLLTRATGHFSLITTTYESFPLAQRCLAEFIASESILSSILGHYYKGIVKNTTVVAGEDELLHELSAHEFTLVYHKRLHIPVVFNNIDELALFGIEGTWFLNSLAIRMLPKTFLIQRLQRLFSKIFTFPYHDTHVIDVVLAKK